MSGLKLHALKTWFVFSLLAFAPLLGAQFIYWDDRALLTHFPPVLNFEFKELFNLNVGGFFPLTLIMLAVQNALFGLNPLAFHLFNIVLHAVNGVLVYLCCRRLFLFKAQAAWLVAALFLIHPLRVEPVAWVSGGLKDLLCAFFFMSALLFASRSYLLMLLLFIGALMAKAMAVTFPLAYLLLKPLRGERIVKNDALKALPLLMLSAAAAVLEMKGQRTSEVLASVNYSVFSGLSQAVQALGLATAKTFAPVGLSVFYDPERFRFSISDFVGIGAALLFFAALLAKRLPKRDWLLLLLFLVLVAPVIKFVPFGKASLFNDRYLYLPSLALSAFLVVGSSHLFKRHWLALALPLLAGLTFLQSRTWKNQETVWLNVLKNVPGSAKGYQNLSLYYLEEGRNEEALESLKNAIAAEPYDQSSKLNLGVLLTRLKRYGEAEKVFLEVLQVEPQNVIVFHNLAYTYHSAGLLKEARAYYQEALRLDPKFEPSIKALQELDQSDPGTINSGSPAKK